MKRKMTTAAEELSETKIPVADLAFKYGYTSTEAFSRAFFQSKLCASFRIPKGEKGAGCIYAPAD